MLKRSTASIAAILLYAVLLLVLPFTGGKSLVSADKEAEDYGTVIGIDLGTTYSCVGVMKSGRVEILANDQGNRITPSYVAFSEGERLVGEAAKNQAASNTNNTVYDIKRLMGRRFTDKATQRELKRMPYKVVDKKGRPAIQIAVNDKEEFFHP
ncbi:hypothetical protein HII13_004134 [Brettanomyces bruxellensis]|nr:hypothetical protein HII13_004134 [Brettanomyces bruxellensis]